MGKNVYRAVKDVEALIANQGARTREHITRTAAHVVDIGHRDHEKTREHVTRTAAYSNDLLRHEIDATRDALGAKIDKIGWAGKSIGWILFELLVAAGIIALGALFFGTHCLAPAYDANGNLVAMVRDWHTWIIIIGVAGVWLIVAHWLIPAGYKKSE